MKPLVASEHVQRSSWAPASLWQHFLGSSGLAPPLGPDVGECTNLRPVHTCHRKHAGSVREMLSTQTRVGNVKGGARHACLACGLHARLASGGPLKSSLSSHRLNTPRTLPSVASFKHRTCKHGHLLLMVASTATRSCWHIELAPGVKPFHSLLTRFRMTRHSCQEPCAAPSACRRACTGSRPLRSPRPRSRDRARSTG